MVGAGAVFDFDVLVVGAGAAGIAATGALGAAGLGVVCLEASDRIGGRVHTDTAIFGVPFDTGAHWLHNEQSNALKAPGLAMGLDLYPAPENGVTHGLDDDAVVFEGDDLVADAIEEVAVVGDDDDGAVEVGEGFL